MELLSYPLPSYLSQTTSQQQLAAGASAEQQAQRQRQQRRQQYGVRLRVAGSGWTPALVLDVAEVAAGVAAGGPQQQVRDRSMQKLGGWQLRHGLAALAVAWLECPCVC